jgi:glycosyltransferase involved in cell wall biosynthesis
MSPGNQDLPYRLVALMPLRDDWVSAAELVRRLDKAFSSAGIQLEVLLVDDCSFEKPDRRNFQGTFSAVQAIRILRLRRNLGHQRAIAIGLAHIQEKTKCSAVLVMDSDGEDTPEGAVELLNAYSRAHGAKVFFAERRRRSESVTFRWFYHLYRALHRALTGVSVRVGNFSIVPSNYLVTLVAMPELWNHYAAAVFRSQLPFKMIPIPRGGRISGTSKMNFVSLVSHGLSAISVFGDIVGVRLLIGSAIGSICAGVGVALVIMIRLFTNLAIPGWATYAAGILAIIAIQLLIITTTFTFITLFSRSNLGFIPWRDHSLFVDQVICLYP